MSACCWIQPLIVFTFMSLQFKEYKIIGRMMPTDKNRTPPLYQTKKAAPLMPVTITGTASREW